MDDELQEVAKRMREKGATAAAGPELPAPTPSPDTKRSRVGPSPPQPSIPKTSSEREESLQGLPEKPLPPGLTCPTTAAPEAAVLPDQAASPGTMELPANAAAPPPPAPAVKATPPSKTTSEPVQATDAPKKPPSPAKLVSPPPRKLIEEFEKAEDSQQVLFFVCSVLVL